MDGRPAVWRPVGGIARNGPWDCFYQGPARHLLLSICPHTVRTGRAIECELSTFGGGAPPAVPSSFFFHRSFARTHPLLPRRPCSPWRQNRLKLGPGRRAERRFAHAW